MKILLAGLYYFLKAVVVVTLRIFYPRTAIINRHLLRIKGPAIILINHPNTLLDALFGAAYLRGITFFLANYSLFKNPLSNWLLNRLFCIPIQRYEDTHGKPLQNEESFARADGHLAGGGRLLIAPEGASLPGRRIRPFKTGAARIALSAESKAGFRLGLVFLPVGLTYERPHRFGDSVVVHVGHPVAIDRYAHAYEADHMTAVRDLTRHLETHMQGLVIHTADDTEDKFLHRTEILLRNSYPLPQKEEYFRSREMMDAFRQWQQYDAPGWERFSRDVRAYFGRLSALGLQDYAVAARSFGFLLWYIPALWLTLPVFLFGYVINALPFHLPGIIADRFKAVPEYKATWKYLGGLVFFPLNYVLLFQALQTHYPSWVCWMVILAAPFAGIAAWRYYQWALHTWQSYRAWSRFRRNPEMKLEWQTFRAAIMEQLLSQVGYRQV